MKYWWVNHKKTGLVELGYGCMWSPQKNTSGKNVAAYKAMARVRSGDFVVSNMGPNITAFGIVTKGSIPAQKPSGYNASSNDWGTDGWLAEVDWLKLSPPKPRSGMAGTISMLLPDYNSPCKSDGHAMETYLSEISQELFDTLTKLTESSYIVEELVDNQETVIDTNDYLGPEPIDDLERTQLTKSRKGQGLYRMRLEAIEPCCRISNVDDPRFMTASHIKPWKHSSNTEKLDGNNGLFLAPHIDRLFDRGWISFSDMGDILTSSGLPSNIFNLWNIKTKNVGPFNSEQARYLAYHRENIFKGSDIT